MSHSSNPSNPSNKRRTFSATFKAEVVLSLLTGTKNQAELCRQHELSPNLLSQWKDAFLQNAAAAFETREQNSTDAARVADLERALKRALENHIPEIHHSDQGGQYAATEYVALLQGRGVRVSMAAVGCPEENGYAERLMRTIKEEHVSPTEYADFADALAQIGQFLSDIYQNKRIHSSLGYLTPAEFEAAHAQETEQQSSISCPEKRTDFSHRFISSSVPVH